MNCPRKEIKSRFEFLYVYQKIKYNSDDLIYIDDFDLEQMLKDNQQIKVILFDHNIPSTSQNFLKNHVSQIIDHHQDNTKSFYQENQLEFVDIRLMGSCQSILAEYFFKNNFQNFISPEIAYSFYSTILIDTQNLNPKLFQNRWIQQDQDIVQSIKPLLQQFYSEENTEYTALENVKFDAQMNLSLGIQSLFIKDYKTFQYNSLNKTLGYSVFLISYQELLNNNQQLIKEIQQFIKQQQLDGLILLFCYKTKDNTLERQFIFYLENEQLLNFVSSNIQKQLQIAPFDTQIPNSQGFKDLTNTYTRKLVEPILQKIFEQFATQKL